MRQEDGSSLEKLPEGLPAPMDDGAADHLTDIRIPDFALSSTSGALVNLANLGGTSIVFCYPMTGLPGVALPEGWDDFPGARGCTPQVCAFRDNYSKLLSFADRVFGLSVQSTTYHHELRARLNLPFDLLSDDLGLARAALKLPTFSIAGETYLKRLTFITTAEVIENVHYPVFPSNEDPNWVLERLAKS